MTRKKQIEDAAYKWAFHTEDSNKNDLIECEYGFKRGAEWADANPQDKIARRTRLSEFRKEIEQLQSERNTLVEVLKDLQHHICLGLVITETSLAMSPVANKAKKALEAVGEIK